MGFTAGPESRAWQALSGPLGLAGTTLGQRASTPTGAPPLAGVVEANREGKHPYVLLLLEEPVSGAAFFTAGGMGDKAFVSISFYLYGDKAAAISARDEPSWHAWIGQQFPAETGAKS